jgi:hypothetical protein
MKHKTLFTVDAVVLLLFGLGFLFVPAPLISFYGAELQPPGVAMGRFFGASMLALAWIVFRSKDVDQSKVVDAIMQGNILVWILAAGIALLGQFQGTFNLMGWSTIALGIFFSTWFTYQKYVNK